MIKIIFVFFLGVVFFIFNSIASSEELNENQAKSIYVMTYYLVSHYKFPETGPKIYLVEQKVMQDLACSGAPCPIHGLQIEDKIYLDKKLDMQNLQNASILVHEYVHYFQWYALGKAADCNEKQRREKEAFSVQNHVLYKVNEEPVKPMIPVCT